MLIDQQTILLSFRLSGVLLQYMDFAHFLCDVAIFVELSIFKMVVTFWQRFPS